MMLCQGPARFVQCPLISGDVARLDPVKNTVYVGIQVISVKEEN